MKNTSRPRVFIGSSSAGSNYAKSVKANLDSIAECQLSTNGFSGLGNGTLASTLRRMNEYDFAVLVLTSDDLVLACDVDTRLPSDNALLEIGVYLGGLGLNRTFIIVDEANHSRLPSGLDSITHTWHDAPDSNEQVDLSTASGRIVEAIAREGVRHNQSRLRFESQVTHERKEGNQSLTIKITNISKEPLAPFRISLQGTPVGSISFFDYERRGVLLNNQQVVFTFLMFENHEPTEMLRHVVRWSEHGDKFTLKLIQDESDNYVLFENAELGRALRDFLSHAFKEGNTGESEFLRICRGEF